MNQLGIDYTFLKVDNFVFEYDYLTEIPKFS